jgi:tRNA modification GTPase
MADTIFALSSGAPPAGIAVIRISGAQAVHALKAMCGDALPDARRAVLRAIRHPQSGDMLDRAMVIWLPGPNNATGEDTVELYCHGGRAVVQAVEDALASLSGLRRAEPGEFTRRAFANGRMDLAEAEALSDLLFAETDMQRRHALRQSEGLLSRAVNDWRNTLLKASAMVEAELDFADEDDVPPEQRNVLNDILRILESAINSALNAPPTERLKDGVRVIIAGPPNSGKSTLFNALVQREAAIVTDIAGTTRDLIEAPIALGGVPLVIIDTAGLHEAGDDRVEAIGMDRARSAMAAADIILWLGDADKMPDHAHIIKINAKADMREYGEVSGGLSLSAETGQGMDVLRSVLLDTAKTLLPDPDAPSYNARQRARLTELVQALSATHMTQDMLIVGEELRNARNALDAITGRLHTEDMLDALFGKFCIGK